MTVTARFFEDFSEGEVLTTPARTIGESEVTQFAQLTGDFNPMHTDATFAAGSSFGERIAHGLLGLSLVPGLVSRTGIFEGTAVAALGVESWAYHKPILFGDTVHVRLTITSTRLTSDCKRGVVGRAVELVNQDGDVVQSGSMPIMVRCR